MASLRQKFLGQKGGAFLAFKNFLFTFFEKKPALQLFRAALNLIIAFQLSAHPFALAQESYPPISAEDQKTGESFLESQESLKNYVFNPQNPQGFYENHPLDIYSLLGQITHKNHKASLYSRAADLLQKISDSPNWKYYSEDFKTAAQKLAKDLKQRKELGFKEGIDNGIKAFLSMLVDHKSIDRPAGIDLPAGFYKESQRLLKRLSKETDISLKNAIVEIIGGDKSEKEAPPLKAWLSHQSRLALAPHLFSQEGFSGFVFKSGAEGEKLSFQINFHEGKIIHRFPNHILWMAFFGPYLIFLEPSKIQEEKALISFIDLSYFEKAIGKTALPVFYIPVHFAEGLSKESLAYPEPLSLEGRRLAIGKLSLSLEEMNIVSRLQQAGFNMTASLTNPASSDLDKDFIESLISAFYEETSKPPASSPAGEGIGQNVKSAVLKFLEHRRQIGSAENPSGPYQNLSYISKRPSSDQISLNLQKELKTALENDPAFQQAVKSAQAHTQKKEKLLNRFFLYAGHLIRPQPMGAPKIKKALGMIANCLCGNETAESRFLAFKEALSQIFYPHKNRLLTGAGLAGAGLIASPESAQYLSSVFELMGAWLGQWAELVTITAESGFTWISSLDAIPKAYFEGDKSLKILEGITAVFLAIALPMGAAHLAINLTRLKREFNKNKAGYQEKTRGWKERAKSLKLFFISKMEEERKNFLINLANEEKRKLGDIIDLSFGWGEANSRQIFKNTVSPEEFYKALSSNNKLVLDMEIQPKDGKKGFLKMESEAPGGNAGALSESQMSLSFAYGDKLIERVWTEKFEGSLSQIIDRKALKPGLSIKLRLSGEDLSIDGKLQNADFSPNEHERLNKIFSEIEKDKGKDILTQAPGMEDKQIQTLKQAIGHLIIGYSSWSATFRNLGLLWNQFFFSRSIYISPVTVAQLLVYSKYFKVVHKDKHTPTVFNGGGQSRLSRISSVRSLSQETGASYKEALLQLENREEKILLFEKKVSSPVIQQVSVKIAALAAKDNESASALSDLPGSVKNDNIEMRKYRLLAEIYREDLFNEALKRLFSSKINDPDMSDKDLKDRVVRNDQILEEINRLTPEEIKKIVEQIDEESGIAEKAAASAEQFISGFAARAKAAGRLKGRGKLNPEKSSQMKRYAVAEKLLNKPEAMARTVRQQLASLKVDTPLAFFYIFLFYAGAEQGILQILHEERFSEESWFYLSRFVIWGAVASIYLNILAGSWLKVQMDSRLDETGGFQAIPSKADAEKPMGFYRWAWRQFTDEENSFKRNYIHGWKLAWANLPAAVITFIILHTATLGRFDIDLLISGYLIMLFGFTGLYYKLENTFEKSANWPLVSLIKRGLDLKGADSRFLSHPAVQRLKMRQSQKLREKWNFAQALSFDNPVGSLFDIFENSHTSTGSRAFSRMFFAGRAPTEYWTSFIDFLEKRNITGSGFSSLCKKIFTNNRTDM